MNFQSDNGKYAVDYVQQVFQPSFDHSEALDITYSSFIRLKVVRLVFKPVKTSYNVPKRLF